MTCMVTTGHEAVQLNSRCRRLRSALMFRHDGRLTSFGPGQRFSPYK